MLLIGVDAENMSEQMPERKGIFCKMRQSSGGDDFLTGESFWNLSKCMHVASILVRSM